MKIRVGFVSNSSSSSFIVRVRSFSFEKKDKDLITQKQLKTLLKYGFKWTHAGSPEVIEWGVISDDGRGYTKTWPDSKNNPPSLAYSVICNESDVIGFLLDQGIKFEGLVHYGHESVFFDGDYIAYVPNAGSEFSLYQWSEEPKKIVDGEICTKAVRVLTREKWLENDGGFWKEAYELRE